MEDHIITFGSEIKSLGNGKIGGYLVRFTSADDPDLDGDFFTKSTDFDIEDGDKVTLYYNHGLDPVLKRRKFGKGEVKTDDVGVWVSAQLQLRDQYETAIYGMVEEGKLGWSSGTLPTLVEREPVGKAMHIKSWPIGKDASLTPTPAAGPILTSIQPLKTWAEATQHLETLIPEADRTSAVERVTVKGDDGRTINVNVSIESGGNTMSEETKGVEDSTPKAPDVVIKGKGEQENAAAQMQAILNEWTAKRVDPLKESVESMSDTMEQILKAMQEEPAIRRGGYYTEDGGAADPQIKSMGDFLLAVRRGDHERLSKVYKSSKTLSEDAGDSGGYLVPTEYSDQWLRISEQTSPIVSRVTTVPVNSRSGEYPVLDIFVTPTAGAGGTAMAAGMSFGVVAEAGTVSETEPGFEMLNWQLYKRGGIVPVSNELNADSPTAIETLLRSLATVAIRNQIERDVLRGTGSGQPRGILNASGAIEVSSVTSSVFALQDAGAMYARFKRMVDDPVWIHHPGIWPDILAMTVATGVAAWQANPQGPVGAGLLGFPLIASEHTPQDDNTGDVILADLGSYLLFQKGQMEVAFSEHAYFTTDRVGWRFTARIDGMPWLKNAITLADPQGSYSVSPFVVHND